MIIEQSFGQGTPKWEDARLDSIGGTGLKSIITNSTGERSKSRDNYLEEKAGNIISRDTKPFFQTWEMKWGHKYEPEARKNFEFIKDLYVDTCAMIFFDESKTWHVSPDFFNRELRFGGEIKCPQLKEFRKTKKNNKLPTKHILQCQAGLALTGFDGWWFMSYFPGLEPFIVWVERDEDLIKIIKAEVRIFLRDLNNLIKELKS